MIDISTDTIVICIGKKRDCHCHWYLLLWQSHFFACSCIRIAQHLRWIIHFVDLFKRGCVLQYSRWTGLVPFWPGCIQDVGSTVKWLCYDSHRAAWRRSAVRTARRCGPYPAASTGRAGTGELAVASRCRSARGARISRLFSSRVSSETSSWARDNLHEPVFSSQKYALTVFRIPILMSVLPQETRLHWSAFSLRNTIN